VRNFQSSELKAFGLLDAIKEFQYFHRKISTHIETILKKAESEPPHAVR